MAQKLIKTCFKIYFKIDNFNSILDHVTCDYTTLKRERERARERLLLKKDFWKNFKKL